MIQVITERFIHTNILAHQSVRRAGNQGRSYPLLSLCLGSFILVCFFMLLWIRIYILETGYQISRAHEQQGILIQENRALRVERAALSTSSRIEKIARGDRGMVTPKHKQIIVLEW